MVHQININIENPSFTYGEVLQRDGQKHWGLLMPVDTRLADFVCFLLIEDLVCILLLRSRPGQVSPSDSFFQHILF
ncbi:hypothetical protein CEXT_148571 [Caerostris extrusa]|uniref:Uncharacterized protein n=1 Tax=Caerostris extrusa TaxID=172846 RepID=A0AAV4UZP1_CAEEX|nr:hypothetical protein CEXT_148571 [Caerostris extrusa]